MVNVCRKCCANAFCTRRTRYNIDGRKTAEYCRERAEEHIVDVNNRRCSHVVLALGNGGGVCRRTMYSLSAPTIKVTSCETTWSTSTSGVKRPAVESCRDGD